MEDLKEFDQDERLQISRKRILQDMVERDEHIKRVKIDNIRDIMALFNNDELDPRDCIALHDLKFNLVNAMVRDCSYLEREEISIPLIVSEKNLHYDPKDAANIGRDAVKLYQQRYDGKSPPKRIVLHRGRPIHENVYYREDTDILIYSIMSYTLDRDEDEFKKLRIKFDRLRGITPEDIEMVMCQSKVSKRRAARALRNANGDMVQAILDIQKSHPT